MNVLESLNVAFAVEPTIVMVNVATKVTAVLVGAWMLHAMLQDRNPRWRILLWRTTGLGLVAVTVVSLGSPLITFSILPLSATDFALSEPARANAFKTAHPIPNAGVDDNLAVRPPTVDFKDSLIPWPAGSVPDLERIEPMSGPRSRVMAQDHSVRTVGTARPVSPSNVAWHLSLWLLLVWLLGVVWGLARMLVGMLWMITIRRSSRPVPQWVEAQVSGCARGIYPKAHVRVRQTDAVAIPCTVGLCRQEVLLPGWLCQAGRLGELRAALSHELEHLRGNDLSWNYLLHGLTLLFWFHPLAWWIRLAHADACDQRCDACAVEYLGDPSGYGRTLARFALEVSVPVTCAPVLAMARRSTVARRIEALQHGLGRTRLPRWKVGSGLITAIAMLCVVGVVGLGRSEEIAPVKQIESAGDDQASTEEVSSDVSSPVSQSNAGQDIYGDSLPRGAISRLGTLRYRHPGWYKRIEFLSDGQTFAVGTSDNTVRLWDATSGKMVHEIDIEDDYLDAFRLSPDGTSIATLSHARDFDRQTRIYNMRLVIWDAISRKEVHRIQWDDPLRSAATQLALSHDGALAVTATRDGTLRLWDIGSADELLSYNVLRGEIESVEFSPNGQLIAVASRSGVKLWDFASEKEPQELDGLVRGGQVVRFSPDGRILAVGSYDDCAARLYDVGSRELIRQLRGNAESYYREGLCFAENGKQLVIPAYRAHAVEVFDVETGELLRSLDTGVIESRGAAVSGDGRLLACIGSHSAIIVWDLESGERISDRFVGHLESPYDIAFARDGQQVVTAGVDATVRIWDSHSGRQIRSLAHDRWVAGLAVSPDAQYVASCGLDDTVRLWELASGRQRFKLPGHGRLGGNGSTEMAFSADGQRFYSFGQDMFLRCYSVRNGRILAEHAIRPSGAAIETAEDGSTKFANADPFHSMVFPQAILSPDATLLLLGGRRTGEVHAFETETGQEIDVFKPKDPLQKFAVSSNADLLATVEQVVPEDSDSNDRESRRFILRVRDLGSKKVLNEVMLDGSFAYQFAFSMDGRLIGVAQGDLKWTPRAKKWVDIWDAATLNRVARVSGYDQAVRAISFSYNGSRLATSHDDSTVLVWDLKQFRLAP